MSTSLKDLAEAIRKAKHLTVFTGAGVSTLSGLRDFRGENGLYREFDADNIFDSLYFSYDPSFYYRHTKDFIYSSTQKDASIVHVVLARLERLGYVKTLITQNIDLLHQKAGSKHVIEIHGSPRLHHCLSCGREKVFSKIVPVVRRGEVPVCEECGGVYKPDITFFGEALPAAALQEAVSESRASDLMLVLGSTLLVQPAASLPRHVLQGGGRIAIVNRGHTPLDAYADFRFDDLEAVFSYLENELVS
ncbi:MAG: NAD-dependent deacetylase [Spirochaetales bacterium]|jgi:NAD-dependent deacetylase|nr:NAD-dependent deacetylase [Spirochaetales bacterium]